MFHKFIPKYLTNTFNEKSHIFLVKSVRGDYENFDDNGMSLFIPKWKRIPSIEVVKNIIPFIITFRYYNGVTKIIFHP